jgi:starch phosphorylase
MKNDNPGKTQKPGTRFDVEIQPVLPERFARLDDLVNDLYYSWSRNVRGLFRHLDQDSWNACGHNPRKFLRLVRQDRIDAAANDPILLAEYRQVLSSYDTYLEQVPATRVDEYLDRETDLVAYFSAEYGFHESMPIYAGGLGILAADYVRRYRHPLPSGLFQAAHQLRRQPARPGRASESHRPAGGPGARSKRE